MNKYEINNEYGYKDYKIIDKVIKRTLKEEKVKNAYFSIVFVDDKTIQDINRDYRGKDRITDVISFAFEDNDKKSYNNIRILGEIYICIPQMERQAMEYGHSKERELSFLTVHGLLQLLGYDHMNAEDEKVMFSKQEMILDGFKETKRQKN